MISKDPCSEIRVVYGTLEELIIFEEVAKHAHLAVPPPPETCLGVAVDYIDKRLRGYGRPCQP